MTSVDFRMPALGADMESGTLTKWLKEPGERFRRGEAIAVAETAKGLIDVEAHGDGRIEALLVQPGTTVPVGAVLARIAYDSAAAPGVPAATPPGTPPPQQPAARPGAPAPPPQGPAAAAGPARLRVSPAARRRAHELGVDLAAVTGTGPEGVVRIEDVERCAGAGAAPAPQRAGMRAAIGAAMSRSKREIPHYYLTHPLDFSPARDWLARRNAALPVAERLIEAVLLVKALALAAAEIEGFSGAFRDGQFLRSEAVHVGTAIALRGGGLVAPALLDAHRKDLPTLMREFSDLVTRVRSGHMRAAELSAPTITLTNLGAEAVDTIFPVINPPQVAILGAGALTDRPWVSEGQIVVRPVLTLTLAGDHRVTDGRAGSRFLRRIAALLARPEAL